MDESIVHVCLTKQKKYYIHVCLFIKQTNLTERFDE